MLALLSTLMILTAMAFAVIVMVKTVSGSWELVVSSLNQGASDARVARSGRSSAGYPIKVLVRSQVRLARAAV